MSVLYRVLIIGGIYNRENIFIWVSKEVIWIRESSILKIKLRG